MDELRLMRDAVHRTPEPIFARARAGLYLMGLYPSSPDSPVHEERRKSFSTSPGISVDEMMSLVNTGSDQGLQGRFLRQIRKSDRNPFKGRISVGRTSNNDVVITHPSVSKLHAHFYPSEDAGVPLRVADAESRNGTWADERPVSTDEPLAIENGSRLRFGDVVCTLFDAPTLYRAVKQLFPLA